MERELKQVRNDFLQASVAANNYNRTLTIVHVSQKDLANSTNLFGRNLNFSRQAMIGATAAAALHYQQLRQIVNITREGQGGLLGFHASLNKLGVANIAVHSLWNNFLGVNRALANAPQWQRGLLGMSNQIKLATVAFAGLKFVPDILNKLALHSNAAAVAGEALFAVVRPFAGILGPLAGHFNNLNGGIGKLAGSIGQSIIGWNVMRGGIQSLMGRVSGLLGLFKELPGWIKAVVGAIALMGPAIVEGLAASLRFTSNLLVGLLQGLKDLSGAFLVIPGIFAMIGASVVPLVGILLTLKNSFGTLFKDAMSGDFQKVTQDLNKMPNYLRPLGDQLVRLTPKLKDLGNQFTATFTAGMGDQIEKIADTYFPAMYNGGTRVSQSFKNIKDEFVGFLLQAQTIQDTNELFSNTARTLNAVARTVAPISQAFRDIGIVGTEFIKDLAERYLPSIAQGFADWAARARETGQMREWMDRSVIAVKELWIGTKNVVQAVWQLLTLFKTGTGDNFLKNFADDMKRFNEAVHRSAASGVLHDIAESVKGVGTDNIKQLTNALKEMAPAFGKVVEFLAQFVGALSGSLIPALTLASHVLNVFFAIINATGGGAVLGTILGIVGAFKLVKLALGPIGDAVRIAVGAFNFFRGIDGIVVSAAAALERLGTVGQAASAKLMLAGDAVAAFASKIALIALVIGGAILAFSQYDDAIAQSKQAQEQYSRSLVEFQGSIKEAISADTINSGENIFTAIKAQLSLMEQELDQTANNLPSWWDHVVGFFKTAGGLSEKDQNSPLLEWFHDPKDINAWQDRAAKAKAAREEITKLGLSTGELAHIVQGSDADFNKFTDSLKQQGEGGKALAEMLETLRNKYKEAEEQAKATTDSTKKTTVAMTEAQAAAAAYGEGAHTLAQALAHIQIEADQANDAITGSSDTYRKFLKTLEEKKAAPALIDTVKQLRQQFENGGAQVKSFADAIDKLHDSMASADDKATTFIESLKKLGKVPDDSALSKYNEDIDNAIGPMSKLVDMLDTTGNALVQQSGKLDLSSKNGRTLSATLEQLRQDNVALVESGRASPEEAFAHTTEAIKRLLTQFGIVDPNIQQKIIDTYFPKDAMVNAIKAQDPQEALKAIIKDPVKLQVELALLTQSQDIINNLLGPDGKLHIPSVIDVVPQQYWWPPGTPNAPHPNAPPPPAGGPQPPPAGQLPPGPLKVPARGEDIPGLIGPAATQFARLQNLSDQQITDLLAKHPDLQATLQPYIDKAHEQGISLSQAFAAGIMSGNDDVKKAIIALAQTAGDGLGSSPAKYGPLSGTGWTYYRGQSFTTDWAGGINSGAGIVKNAAKDVAYGAVTGMKDKSTDAFKQLSDIGSLIGHIVDFAKQMTSTFIEAGKALNLLSGGKIFPKRYVPDPLRLPPNSRVLPWSPGGWNPQGGGAPGGGGGGANLYQDSAGNWHSRDPWWEGVIQAESGGRLNPQENPTHFGLFQFAQSTWDSIAKSIAPEWVGKNPGTAPAEVQARMAQENYNRNRGNLYGQWANPYVAAHPGGTTGLIYSAAMAGAYPPTGVPGQPGEDARTFAHNVMMPFWTKLGFQVGDHAADQFGEHQHGAIDVMVNSIEEGNKVLAQALRDPNVYGAIFNRQVYGYEHGAAGRPYTGDNPHLDHVHIFYQPGRTGNIVPLGSIPLPAAPAGPPPPPPPAPAPPPPPGAPTTNPKARPGAPNGMELLTGPDGKMHWYNTQGIEVYGPAEAKHGQPVAPPPAGAPPPPAGAPPAPPKPPATGPRTGLPKELNVVGWIDSNGDVWDAITGGNKIGTWGGTGPHGEGAFTPLGGAPPAAPPAAAGPAAPDGSANDPLHVTTPDTGQLGNLDTQTQVQQALQDIGVPRSISSQADAVTALQAIDAEITRQNELQTPQGKMMADQLSQVHSAIQEQWGLKEAPSGLDTFASIASGVGGIASDVIGDFQSFVEVIGATKNIADTLVRGPASTEDVIGIIQNFQKYLEFAAKIANTVGDIAGQIGGIMSAAGGASGMPGAGSAGAALQAVQAIAQVIAGVIQGINAAISIGIESWHIFGSYFGQFLGFLAGGPAGLMGNVKFLLDQNTGQLISYSTDNPLKRNALPVPGQVLNPQANNQTIGQLNYYAGPGQDPRDSTRQMMYQVKTSQMNTVTAQ